MIVLQPSNSLHYNTILYEYEVRNMNSQPGHYNNILYSMSTPSSNFSHNHLIGAIDGVGWVIEEAD